MTSLEGVGTPRHSGVGRRRQRASHTAPRQESSKFCVSYNYVFRGASGGWSREAETMRSSSAPDVASDWPASAGMLRARDIVRRQGAMVMRLSTFVTPSARQAVASASCRSAMTGLASKLHLSADWFNVDALGVKLRVAAKGVLDLGLDFRGRDARRQRNEIDYAFDSPDFSEPLPRPACADNSTRPYLRG